MLREAIKATVDLEKCTSCGVCARVCPFNAIDVDITAKNGANIINAACISCGACAVECKFNAINIPHFQFDHTPNAEPLGYVFINRERCKGCGYCVEYCPRNVLEIGKDLSSKGYQLASVKDGARCLACSFCEYICPEFAITLFPNKINSLSTTR